MFSCAGRSFQFDRTPAVTIPQTVQTIRPANDGTDTRTEVVDVDARLMTERGDDPLDMD
jgi:hypothetical protein